MKRMIIMAAALFAMAAYTPEVQAQGFLKGLVDKVKDKAKEKAESEVSNAADAALNGKKSKGGKQSLKTMTQTMCQPKTRRVISCLAVL